MQDPIIFLDIDGVLNHHQYDHASQSSSLHPGNVDEFNRLLRNVPDAKIVLTSAWRYMILNGAMTLKGFEYLLRTHGVQCVDRLIDTTCSDEKISPRGQQIWDWFNRNGGHGNRRYVVLDDGGKNDKGWTDMEINACRHPVVWINGNLGLMPSKVYEATEILRG